MAPPHVNYEVLNDEARWADPYDCIDLQVAGIWYLFEV